MNKEKQIRKTSLSKKRQDKLYSIVHEEVMQVRIKIAILMNGKEDGKEIDTLLSDLCFKAPQAAIDLFKIELSLAIEQNNLKLNV